MAKSLFDSLIMGVAKAADRAIKEAARERAREVKARERAEKTAMAKAERELIKADNARAKALEKERITESKRQINNGHNMGSI